MVAQSSFCNMASGVEQIKLSFQQSQCSKELANNPPKDEWWCSLIFVKWYQGPIKDQHWPLFQPECSQFPSVKSFRNELFTECKGIVPTWPKDDPTFKLSTQKIRPSVDCLRTNSDKRRSQVLSVKGLDKDLDRSKAMRCPHCSWS